MSTEICSALRISLPIIGAPMGSVAGPELAAAVSNAGGLGMLGQARVSPGDVRSQIRETKALTDKPFGVGLLFPSDQQIHEASSSTGGSSQQHRGLPEFLQPLAEGWTLESEFATGSYDIDDAMLALDVVIEEGVKILACGLGTPRRVVDRAHAAGILVISLVGSRKAAVEVEAAGADIVVAQGHEAGGHTGRVTTLVLVPQLVDAVKIPVIAGGGIADGRGLAAALMLGASGVWIGTRLLATPEARTIQGHKERVVGMTDDDTIVSRSYTGKPSRVLRNAFTRAWSGHEAEILPMPDQWDLVRPLVSPAKEAGSMELANWPTGQAAVLIDEIAPAGVIVQEMAAEAAAIIRDGAQRLVVGA